MKKTENTPETIENAPETIENAPKTELVTKKYTGYTKDGNLEIVLNSAKLIEHTENIYKFVKVGRSAQLGVAYELASTYKDESYKSSFKNIDDYALAMFNIKHSTSTLYRQVGELFVSVNENGVPYVKDGLPQFSVGQLIEILPLYKGVNEEDGKARLIELLNNGAFGQFSTTRAIRDAVKDSLLIESTSTVAEATTENTGTTTESGTTENATSADIIATVKGYLETLNVKLEKDNASNDIKSKVLSIMASVDELNQMLR